MAQIIQNSHCIKKFVKKGFIDEYELEAMFGQARAREAIIQDEVADHITKLIKSLESQVPKPEKSLETLLDEINLMT